MSSKNRKTLFYLTILFFFCFPGSLSCFVTHQDGAGKQNTEKETQVPQIIFLNYSARFNKSTGVVEIQLINKIITEGRLKMNSPGPLMSKPGDLECITLNGRNEPVDIFIISDPLNITVESVDENNSLFKKEITRDSAQFSIRFQLKENIQSIAVKKNTNADSQNSYLLVTKIKEL